MQREKKSSTEPHCSRTEACVLVVPLLIVCVYKREKEKVSRFVFVYQTYF